MKLQYKLRIFCSVIFLSLTIGFISLYPINKSEKTYIFDSDYSFFVQDPKSVCYSPMVTYKISRYNTIIFSTIHIPTFNFEFNGEKKLLSKKCEEIYYVPKDKEYNLIKLICEKEYLAIVPEVHNKLKIFNLISMKFIDGRRWQVVILKNEQMITIDFAAGLPDVRLFKELDEKYNLTQKYKHIDLRFQNKIGITE
jgi:hypothetical protein